MNVKCMVQTFSLMFTSIYGKKCRDFCFLVNGSDKIYFDVAYILFHQSAKCLAAERGFSMIPIEKVFYNWNTIYIYTVYIYIYKLP